MTVVPITVLLITSPAMSSMGIDPTPYTAWGVLGLLGLVVLVGLLIAWRLFAVQARSIETSNSNLMGFIDNHRREFSSTLQNVTERQSQALEQALGTFSRSNEKFSRAFDRQARNLEEVLIADRAFNRLAALQSSGASITHNDVETIVREVIRQRTTSSGDETLNG